MKKTRNEIRKAWMFCVEQARKGQDVAGTALNAAEDDEQLLKVIAEVASPELAEALRSGELSDDIVKEAING